MAVIRLAVPYPAIAALSALRHAARWLGRFFLALSLAGCFSVSASCEENGDLRDLRIGVTVAELPAQGYTGFGCAGHPEIALAGWSDYAKCPADGGGLHPVTFQYDDSVNPMARVSEKAQGTKVGGHPVILTLLIDGAARVQGLRIETDPGARLYMHKKAFHIAEQIKVHYGPENWTCTKEEPADREEPIGGLFIKEHCEKSTPTRRFDLHRALYHRSGDDVRKFVDRTELTILLAK